MEGSKMMTNTHLNHYFENEVKLSRDENSKARELVFAKVDKLLQYINKEDQRFGKTPMKIGSSFQGLKTKAPDEFDFNIVLVDLPEFTTVPYKQRYYGFRENIDEDALKSTPKDIDIVTKSVPLPAPPKGSTFVSYSNHQNATTIWRYATDLIFKDDIIPYLVRKQLKDLLQKAIRDLELRGELRLGRKVHGPALTLRIPYNKDGIEEISVDFAPTIPNIAKIQGYSKWPPAHVQWPSKSKIAELMQVPLNGIAKEPFVWLLSFARCEQVLMEEIDKDGGCRKKAHRIMKRLREEFWCKTSKPVISSYFLKNILFLECERYPNTHDWETNMLATRISSMVQYLIQCMKTRTLPQYFNREVNLIPVHSAADQETLSLEQKKVEDFLENPARFFTEQ